MYQAFIKLRAESYFKEIIEKKTLLEELKYFFFKIYRYILFFENYEFV